MNEQNIMLDQEMGTSIIEHQLIELSNGGGITVLESDAYNKTTEAAESKKTETATKEASASKQTTDTKTSTSTTTSTAPT